MSVPSVSEVVAAIKAKDLPRLERALDYGAPLNKYVEDKTPLGHAASVGFTKGIEYLLGLYEIEPNKGKPDGASPLMIAASKDRKHSIEKMLLFPDVDINHADAAGNTALLKAIKKGAGDSFGVLINNPDINIEKANGHGETPLLLAAQGNKPQFVEALLQKGADFNIKIGESTIYEKAVYRKFEPLINRMITNMKRYGIPYNSSITNIEVKPLAGLGAGVKIDLYPVTAKGQDFLSKATPFDTPYPVKNHTIAEAIAFKPEFLKMQSLVREMCTGLETMYLYGKIQRIDFYLTLTYGDPTKLVGFVYTTVYKTAKDFLLI
jgi:hypothetical protein